MRMNNLQRVVLSFLHHVQVRRLVERFRNGSQSRLSSVHLPATLLACSVMPVRRLFTTTTLALAFFTIMLPAQSPAPITNAQRWLRAVKTPHFILPSTKEAWEKQRLEI